MSRGGLPKYEELKNWSVINVFEWLERNGFNECKSVFINNNTDGVKLAGLTETELRGYSSISEKQRRKLLKLVNEIEGSPHRKNSLWGSLSRTKYSHQNVHDPGHHDDDDSWDDDEDSDEGYEQVTDDTVPKHFPWPGHSSMRQPPGGSNGVTKRRTPPPPPPEAMSDDDDPDDYLSPNPNLHPPPKTPARRTVPAPPPIYGSEELLSQPHKKYVPPAPSSVTAGKVGEHRGLGGWSRGPPVSAENDHNDPSDSPLPPPRPPRRDLQHVEDSEEKKVKSFRKTPSPPSQAPSGGHTSKHGARTAPPLPAQPPSPPQELYEEMDNIPDDTYELPSDQRSGDSVGSNSSIQDRPLPAIPGQQQSAPNSKTKVTPAPSISKTKTHPIMTTRPPISIPSETKTHPIPTTRPPISIPSEIKTHPIPTTRPPISIPSETKAHSPPTKSLPAIPKVFGTSNPPIPTPSGNSALQKKQSTPQPTQKFIPTPAGPKKVTVEDTEKKSWLHRATPPRPVPKVEEKAEPVKASSDVSESAGTLSIQERIKLLNSTSPDNKPPITKKPDLPGNRPTFGNHKKDTPPPQVPTTPPQLPPTPRPSPAKQAQPAPPASPASSTSDDLYSFEWYHGQADRTICKSKLTSIGRDGAFIIRKSAQGGASRPYTIQLYCQGRDYNIPIRLRDDNTYALGKDVKRDASGRDIDKCFKSLHELVVFHKSTDIVLQQGVNCKLTLHASR